MKKQLYIKLGIGIPTSVIIICLIAWYYSSHLKDELTLISTIASISLAGFITTIIFLYQEKEQNNNQLALIDVDLLSTGRFNKEYLNRVSFLYTILYGFNQLSSVRCQYFCEFYNLRKFVGNSIIDAFIKDYASRTLNEIDKNRCDKNKVSSILDNYKKQISSYAGEEIRGIKKSKFERDIKDKKWIIVIGSKYENGKIIDPTLDKKTADFLKENSKKVNLKISSIKRDTDIYFSDDRSKNLVVVGGTTINKFTLSIHDKLIIQSIKIQKYNIDGKYENYLVNRVHSNLKIVDKHTYSIQVIENPHSEKDHQSYIIVLYGLDRYDTEKAAKKFIQEGEPLLFPYDNDLTYFPVFLDSR